MHTHNTKYKASVCNYFLKIDLFVSIHLMLNLYSDFYNRSINNHKSFKTTTFKVNMSNLSSLEEHVFDCKCQNKSAWINIILV